MSKTGNNILFVLFLASILCCTRQGPSSSPNILWIYVDDMSDWLECYGDSTVKTPHINSLADEGIRFDRAYVPVPVCSSTRSALITGAMPTTYGLHHHRTEIKKPLPEGLLTVPELFREAGYLTFNEAKDDYNFIKDRSLMYSPDFERPGLKGGHFQGRDLSWLEQLKGKKFFGQIQLAGGKWGGETGAKYPVESSVREDQVSVPPQYPDHPVFRNAIARHYEQILETDAQVGAIIEALKEYGLWENTAVFFFTDHGSPLPRSKQFVYEEGTKVPLIIHWPESVKLRAPKSKVRQDLVSGIDIPTTSLALAGINIPSTMEGLDLFADDFQEREFVISCRDRMGNAIDHIRAVRTDSFRYIRNYKLDRPLFQLAYRHNYATFTTLRELRNEVKLTPLQNSYFETSLRPGEELYDHRKDPHETVNLADRPEYEAVLKKHRQILKDWEEKTDDQGRYPISKAYLEKWYEIYGEKCVTPEYDFIREREKTLENK